MLKATYTTTLHTVANKNIAANALYTLATRRLRRFGGGGAPIDITETQAKTAKISGLILSEATSKQTGTADRQGVCPYRGGKTECATTQINNDSLSAPKGV